MTITLPRNQWVELDLSTASFFDIDGVPSGLYVGGAIVINPDLPSYGYATFFFSGLTVSPTCNYQIEVTGGESATHIWLGPNYSGIRTTGSEDQDDDWYHMVGDFEAVATATVYNMGPATTVDNSYTYDSWVEAVADGSLSVIFEVEEDPAITRVRIKQDCGGGGGIPPRRIFQRSDGATHGAPRVLGSR